MIDGIAQYADQIKIQLDPPTDQAISTSYTRVAEEPIVRLEPLSDLPEDIKLEVQRIFAKAKPALESGPTSSISEKIRILKVAVSDLRLVQEKILKLTLKSKTHRETSYVVKMQLALMLSEVGNVSVEGKSYFEEASAIYSELETDFPKRLVIFYRHAKVLDALGHSVLAIERLRELISRLDQPRRYPTPHHHWVRAAAPRVLGVVLWEEAVRVGRLGGPESSSAALRKIELLTEAYDVTKAAYEKNVKDDPLTPNHHPTEKAKAANNLLYYELELADAKHALGESYPFKRAEVENYLTQMDAIEPTKLSDPRFLDTAMRAFTYLGEAGKAAESARRLLEIVEPLTKSEWPDSRINKESAERARHILATPVTEGTLDRD